MLLVLMISYISTVVHSISDLVYFDQSKASFSAKIILANVTMETLRKCEIACADTKPLCTALSYASPPNCVLLGDQNDGATCGAGITVSEKKMRKPDERKRFVMISDYMPDPCYTAMHPEKTLDNSSTGICMRNNQLNLVIRAVNETGSMITLDNEVSNMLTFDISRNMWKFEHTPTGFVQWLVGLCCVETKAECGCTPIPMLHWSYRIHGGVEAQIDALGACADRTHQLTYWGGKFKQGINKVTISPSNAGKMNGTKGVCTRDWRNMVIRGVYEDDTRVTFDNNLGNVLAFDSERNMWKLSYKPRDFERWLIAVSCVNTKNVENCGCAKLPMMDASYNIVGGVEAQIDAQGACADKSHQLTYWGGKYAAGQNATTVSSSSAAEFKIHCQAGIWLYTKLDNSDGWQVTNATCAPVNPCPGCA